MREQPARSAPREHGILFDPEGVLLLLSGRKTQTRRVASARNDFAPGDRLWVKEPFCERPDGGTFYRATSAGLAPPAPWRPGLFMSRERSRLALRVRATRVERLHAITREDCVREIGAHPEEPCPCAAYRRWWDRFNGPRVPWGSNPMVRVIDFVVVEVTL